MKKLLNIRNLIGIFLIILGLSFLFDAFNIFSFGWLMGFFWPLLLIIIGVNILSSDSQSKAGIIITIIGGIFLISHIVPFINAGALILPAIFICIGVLIIYNRSSRSFQNSTSSDQNKIDSAIIFSGIDKQITSQNFQGGSITSIFGGGKLDLTDARLENNKAVLEVSAIFGGIELILPKSMRIDNKGTSVLGEFADRSHPDSDADQTLVIKGEAVFGGVEIKN